MPAARHLPFLVLLLTFLSGPADGGSKLDPHARIALAQLRAGSGKSAALDARGDLDVFVVGTATRAELEAAGAIVRTVAGDVRTATIPADAVERVEALAGVLRIEGAVRLEPQLDKSVPATGLIRGPAPEFFGLNGEGVLVGAIDEGFDYDHEDFKDEQGHTRFVAIWDQTDDITGTPPAGYSYGSEWNAAQIEAGIANEQDLTGHGTGVLGILAGDGSATGGDLAPFTYAGMAPKAPIVAIKSSLSSTSLIDAAAYFFARAQQLGLPASLNISLGSQYGPHDGTSPMEAALTALSGPARVVSVAAGNDRASAGHAVVFAGLPTPQNNAVMFVGAPRVGDVVVIAGYYSAAEPMTVELRHTCLNCETNVVTTGPIAPGHTLAPYPGVETGLGRLYVENGITQYPGGMREVYAEFEATEAGQGFGGSWSLKFVSQAPGPTNGRVDLWRVFATPTLANFTAGRSDDMLVIEPANAHGVISVGAWATKVDWTDCAGVPNQFYPVLGQVGELASFSSPGPTRDGRPKPDIAAPGCEIASATSFDVPVVCSPASAFHLSDGMQHTINQGTSMSAPHVAGAAALVFQALGPVDAGVVKSWLTGHALTDAHTGAVPNLDWGSGKLDLSALHTTSVRAPVSGLSLAPIRPNPLASDRIRVDFTLPRAGDATVTLVDVRGRTVATLARGAHAAGAHAITAPLARVAPGLYFVTLATEAGRVTRRVLLLGRGG